jgi:hypothetical protein
MAALTDAVKEYIVQQLAMYAQPQHVADLVEQEFGVTIDRQQVFKYKPGKSNLSKKLKDLFDKTRADFLDQLVKIPIANKTYRLKMLQTALEKVMANPRLNTVELRYLLEQAAKEEGGLFTNQRRIAGANGEPLFDSKAFANDVLQELLREGGNMEESIQFVVDRYQISRDDLVSDANN